MITDHNVVYIIMSAISVCWLDSRMAVILFWYHISSVRSFRNDIVVKHIKGNRGNRGRIFLPLLRCLFLISFYPSALFFSAVSSGTFLYLFYRLFNCLLPTLYFSFIFAVSTFLLHIVNVKNSKSEKDTAVKRFIKRRMAE